MLPSRCCSIMQGYSPRFCSGILGTQYYAAPRRKHLVDGWSSGGIGPEIMGIAVITTELLQCRYPGAISRT
jgi:hypothetical protein